MPVLLETAFPNPRSSYLSASLCTQSGQKANSQPEQDQRGHPQSLGGGAASWGKRWREELAGLKIVFTV